MRLPGESATLGERSMAARPAGWIEVARVYDRPPAGPALRVLVDRLWPRGVARVDAPWDLWLPAVAPTTALRRWYGHDASRLAEFTQRYRRELVGAEGGRALNALREAAGARPLLLLTATRDLALSHAAVLVTVLQNA